MAMKGETGAEQPDKQPGVPEKSRAWWLDAFTSHHLEKQPKFGSCTVSIATINPHGQAPLSGREASLPSAIHERW